MALSLATCRMILISSKIVTMSEPKAIEPRDSVDARPKADAVGCAGIWPCSRGPK